VTPEGNPFDSAISELENRIRAMQITLETLKQLRSQPDGAAQASLSISPRLGDSEVQHDSFFGMTIADATKKYLGMTKHTKSTADIATALESGGLKHASKDFHTTIRSTLGQKEEFLRVNGDWGLTEWYPGAGRGRKAAKPEKATTTHAAKPRPAKTPKPKASTPGGPTRKERILKVMKTDPAKSWTALEIAKATGDGKRTSIQATLWSIAKDGDVVKTERGYRLTKAA
jgi:hypothetical protein